MMQRNEEGELNHFGVTLENGGDNNHRYGASSTGIHSVSRSSLGNYSALLSLSRIGSKEEDCNIQKDSVTYYKLIFSLISKGHGSSLSLVSTASSLYSSQEEKQASEIRKLKRELGEAHEKVNTLSGQLSTNVLPAIKKKIIFFFHSFSNTFHCRLMWSLRLNSHLPV